MSYYLIRHMVKILRTYYSLTSSSEVCFVSLICTSINTWVLGDFIFNTFKFIEVSWPLTEVLQLSLTVNKMSSFLDRLERNLNFCF